MGKINRQTILEIMRTFFTSLFFFSFLLIFVLIWQQAQSYGLSLWNMLRMTPYLVPEILRYSVPISLLLAVTTSFSRMSGANEIVALKSLGVSPWRIMWPTMLFALFVSVFSVWINDLAVTWGRSGMASILAGAADQIIFDQLRTKHSFSMGGYSVSVKGIDGKRLFSPTLTTNSQTINADTADLDVNVVDGSISVRLQKVKVVDPNGRFAYEADIFEDKFPISAFLPDVNGGTGTSDLAINRIPAEIQIVEENMEQSRQRTATQSAFTMLIGDFQELTGGDWQSYQSEQERLKNRLIRLNLEPTRRWASGFTCFFFVWVGVPFAVWLKKADVFTAFFACFVPILILYYPIFIFGLNSAKDGLFPPVFVWTANVGLFFAGFWFITKVVRY